MHNQIFSMKKSSRSIGRRNDKPSPARGEGFSVRLTILLCSQASANVGAFPLVGEGGTAKP